MTLGRFIDTVGGKTHQMAGINAVGTRMLSRRKALGYTEVFLRRHCLLGGPGRLIRGHEFHYSEIVESGDGRRLEFAYELRGAQRGSCLARRLSGRLCACQLRPPALGQRPLRSRPFRQALCRVGKGTQELNLRMVSLRI